MHWNDSVDPAQEPGHITKKSVRWVPKLLTNGHKEERIWTYEKFLALVRRCSVAMLDSMVTIDESAVSFHSWRPSSSRSNGLKKVSLDPFQGKVHSTRSKQMVLVFFYVF
jgi:hypothetical protein